VSLCALTPNAITITVAKRKIFLLIKNVVFLYELLGKNIEMKDSSAADHYISCFSPESPMVK
jgi:hypothetical protein